MLSFYFVILVAKLTVPYLDFSFNTLKSVLTTINIVLRLFQWRNLLLFDLTKFTEVRPTNLALGQMTIDLAGFFFRQNVEWDFENIRVHFLFVFVGLLFVFVLPLLFSLLSEDLRLVFVVTQVQVSFQFVRVRWFVWVIVFINISLRLSKCSREAVFLFFFLLG
jgi:hypothetical protein